MGKSKSNKRESFKRCDPNKSDEDIIKDSNYQFFIDIDELLENSKTTRKAKKIQSTGVGTPKCQNAFILYRRNQAHNPKYKNRREKDKQADISKEIGANWKHETEDVKKLFYALNRMAKKKYSEKNQQTTPTPNSTTTTSYYSPNNSQFSTGSISPNLEFTSQNLTSPSFPDYPITYSLPSNSQFPTNSNDTTDLRSRDDILEYSHLTLRDNNSINDDSQFSTDHASLQPQQPSNYDYSLQSSTDSVETGPYSIYTILHNHGTNKMYFIGDTVYFDQYGYLSRYPNN
ncbi:hypothetical protein C1645_748424 [Glomus cerebriforme]|uniref:HMG box domain-containing protein n=1 Tax=Glomus cerebriforme TaxID=658196 RepID=A0A397TKY1_9GLOM|nr:hypothetical protein C1645_748424 [Glomus cerebriforme]